MRKSYYATILGLLFIASLSCSSDDDNGATSCIDPGKIDDHAMCPAVVDPVCGCDGVTYDNDCEAKANGVLKWTAGPC